MIYSKYVENYPHKNLDNLTILNFQLSLFHWHTQSFRSDVAHIFSSTTFLDTFYYIR